MRNRTGFRGIRILAALLAAVLLTSFSAAALAEKKERSDLLEAAFELLEKGNPFYNPNLTLTGRSWTCRDELRESVKPYLKYLKI